jgi:hypothetical protein
MDLDGNSHIATNGAVVIAAAYGGRRQQYTATPTGARCGGGRPAADPPGLPGADGATSGVNVARIEAGGGLGAVSSVPHAGGSGVHQGSERCVAGGAGTRVMHSRF